MSLRSYLESFYFHINTNEFSSMPSHTNVYFSLTRISVFTNRNRGVNFYIILGPFPFPVSTLPADYQLQRQKSLNHNFK